MPFTLLKDVSYKEQKEVMVDLKKVYQALTLEEAELEFSNFKEKWGKKHPIIIKSWEANWLELTSYFSFPTEIRRLIYTTNTIEGYHRQLRKVTKTKTAYPTDESLPKVDYLFGNNGKFKEVDYACKGMERMYITISYYLRRKN